MKHWLLFLIIPLVIGCQSPNKKKGPALRCLYDQSVFAAVCREAVAEEQKFQVFKQDPFYSFFFQGYSYEQGWDALREIQHKHPALIARFDALRSVDQMGEPEVYAYAEFGVFSPTTLHHILLAGTIQEKMQQTQLPRRIVQIGAGYGALCKILHDLNLWDEYTIVDLPEHLELARKVLQRQGIEHVSFYAIDELARMGHYDLAISDLSFSEFSRTLQKRLIDQVLLHANAGCVWGHVFPKHFGVEALSPGELEAYFKKNKGVSLEMQQTQDERTFYYFNFIKEKT